MSENYNNATKEELDFLIESQKSGTVAHAIRNGEKLPSEENPKFSEIASEFAEKTAKQATEDPESMKIENQTALEQVEFASRFFQMYNKRFGAMIDKMPKKSAARVIKRIMAYPLETPSDMSWTSKEEKDAFLIGNQLAETKYMLFKYVAMEEAEKAKLAQETNKTEEKINGKVQKN